MHSAIIVCVGDELLAGDTVDAHGAYVGRYLTRSGLRVREIRLVGDSLPELRAALESAAVAADLVVVAGGLGPTRDDLTREAAALAAGSELLYDAEAAAQIQSFLGRRLDGSNQSQAYRPEGFASLANRCGTAPGLLGTIGACRVVALPGPPHELKDMIEVHGERIVDGLRGEQRPEGVFSCFGVPESRLEDALREIARDAFSGPPGAGPDIDWHTRAEPSRIVLRLTGATGTEYDVVRSALAGRFGGERIIQGEDSLASVVVKDLAARGVLLAAAESCTGGMIGAAITDVPGSSAVFWGSLVTYANAAKVEVLGVREQTLDRHGAVSEQCVREMAEGARVLSGSDVAVAVSGIAGPDGGSPDKPVGTVWFAAATANGTSVLRALIPAGRDRVRRHALVEALLFVRRVVTFA